MMKNLKILVLIFGIVAFLAVSGCTGNDSDSQVAENVAPDTPAHSADALNSMMDTQPSSPPSVAGAVVETMNAAGYTYVKIDTGSGEVWAAGPETVVKVGDNVAVSGGMMYGFSSSSLGMTFDEIIFSDKIIITGETNSSTTTGEMNGSTDSVPSPHGGNLSTEN